PTPILARSAPVRDLPAALPTHCRDPELLECRPTSRQRQHLLPPRHSRSNCHSSSPDPARPGTANRGPPPGCSVPHRQNSCSPEIYGHLTTTGRPVESGPSAVVPGPSGG